LALLVAVGLAGCERPPEPIEPVAAAAPGFSSAFDDSSATAETSTSSSTLPILVNLFPASDSNVSGHLTLSPTYGGIRMLGQFRNLAAGSVHGFHLHEIGDCSAPDASSAGAHFNPAGTRHGNPDEGMHHAGDLSNLRADANGEIAVDVLARNLEIGTGHSADIAGRAIVLHAGPDDYTSQPAGDSGDRIACGVIGAAART
jgi:Cu-Zn family superoxide dismutase